jgi:Zn-dependent M32 family carboxypeptidase
MDKESLIFCEHELRKAELLYRLNGDISQFCNQTKSLTKQAKKIISESNHIIKPKENVYNDFLNYQGDLEIKSIIENQENDFRNVRKYISKDEYEKRLKKLILLRNEYANTVGFDDFISYKYSLFGISTSILDKKIKETKCPAQVNTNYIKNIIKNFRTRPELYETRQLSLLKKLLEFWKLDLKWRNISIHTTNLPPFYVGACVALSIPNDIHVLMNLQPGLSGFAVFLHEVGHAYYYNHIDIDIYNPTTPPHAYNLVVEEALAILFENLAYNRRTIEYLFQEEMDLYMDISEIFLPYYLVCITFEEYIYHNSEADFENVWCKLCTKYNVSHKDWTAPHFFVSNPGYFAAYFLGNRLADSLYKYIQKNNIELNSFLINSICKHGINLNYTGLLKKIDF